MMARRRTPSATPSWISAASSSGPRCTNVSTIACRRSACRPGRPASAAPPAIPHISRPPSRRAHPETGLRTHESRECLRCSEGSRLGGDRPESPHQIRRGTVEIESPVEHAAQPTGLPNLPRQRERIASRKVEDPPRSRLLEDRRARNESRPAAVVTDEQTTRGARRQSRGGQATPREPPLAESPGDDGKRPALPHRRDRLSERESGRVVCITAEGQDLEPLPRGQLTPGQQHEELARFVA